MFFNDPLGSIKGDFLTRRPTISFYTRIVFCSIKGLSLITLTMSSFFNDIGVFIPRFKYERQYYPNYDPNYAFSDTNMAIVR